MNHIDLQHFSRVSAVGPPKTARTYGTGFINCNARLYDPFIGRFLAPDPLIQDPSSTQNFNRYSYCLNNPLKYTDESGEWIHILAGGLIGGTLNLIANWENCEGFWEYAAAFSVGAASGAVTAATAGATSGFFATIGGGMAVATVAGASTSATNSIISQTSDNFSEGSIDWGYVGKSSIAGGVSGAAGYFAGGWASEKVGDIAVNGFRIKSPVLSSGLNGLAGGAVGGMAGGFTTGYIMTGDAEHAWKMSIQGALSGGIVGGSLGVAEGYIHSKLHTTSSGTDIEVTAEDLGLQDTMERIRNNIKDPHLNDGNTFQNRFDDLPKMPNNYYKEYVHRIPGAPMYPAGTHRIIIGGNNEVFYYSPDHYHTFIRFKP